MSANRKIMVISPVQNKETGLFELKRIEWDDCTPVGNIARWDGISSWQAFPPSYEVELTPEDIKALYE